MAEPTKNREQLVHRKPGGQFAAGSVPNPSGRPRGSRNKTTLAVEALLEGQHQALTQAAVDKALEGDTTALKLCLDRIAPIRKGRPVPLDIPELKDAQSLSQAGVIVGNALAAGELSSEEAAGVMATLDGVKKLYETSELERRISDLEKAAEERKT